MDKKTKRLVLKELKKKLVHNRISKNKKEFKEYLLELLKEFNPIDVKRIDILECFKEKDLRNDEDYKIIFRIFFDNNNSILGDMFYLKTKIKNIVFITDISID